MKNVIVTGGSRGIGLAIARDLEASEEFRPISVARSHGDAVGAFVSWDLESTNSLGTLFRLLRKEFGPIYGLINNAGIGTAGVLATMPETDIERLFRLNVVSPVVLTRHVVRHMLATREGRIINMASIVANTGYAGLSVYSATKAALIGFTKSLAREAGTVGVTVNAIAPGFLDTEMTHSLDARQRAQIARRSALQRLSRTDDVAAAVRFLLSEQARNITGTTITVDAGNTA